MTLGQEGRNSGSFVPDRAFRTDDLPASKRVSAWREVLSEVYYRLDLRDVAVQDWRAGIRETVTGSLAITRFLTGGARAFRTRSLIASDPSDHFVIMMSRRGTMFYSQLGRSGFIGPGNYVLVRSSDFYELSCDQEFAGTVLKLPVELVQKRYRAAADHCACAFPNNPAIAQVVRVVAETVDELDPQQRKLFARDLQEQMLDCVAMMLRGERELCPEAPAPAARDLFRRIAGFLEECYGDPLLSPRMTADAFGISLGYLHRVFQRHGTSFGRYLRDLRLGRAFERLATGGGEGVRVGEVAFEVGFLDHSLFSRAFREAYGITPSDCARGRRNP